MQTALQVHILAEIGAENQRGFRCTSARPTHWFWPRRRESSPRPAWLGHIFVAVAIFDYFLIWMCICTPIGNWDAYRHAIHWCAHSQPLSAYDLEVAHRIRLCPHRRLGAGGCHHPNRLCHDWFEVAFATTFSIGTNSAHSNGKREVVLPNSCAFAIESAFATIFCKRVREAPSMRFAFSTNSRFEYRGSQGQ